MKKWKRISLKHVRSKLDTLTISKSGIFFSSQFIKKFDLSEKKSIAFYESEDIYLIGFEFFDSKDEPDSLKITRPGGALSRSVGANEIINNHKVLSKIQQDPSKENRVFEIQESDEADGIFYIYLKPMFEKNLPYSKVDSLSKDIKGIYRYKDGNDDIIYIGKGNIKSRAKSQERKKWDIRQIEYSEIAEEEKMLHWEAYHLNQFVNQKGGKPKYNVLMGNKLR